jgi:hypothetical protein
MEACAIAKIAARMEGRADGRADGARPAQLRSAECGGCGRDGGSSGAGAGGHPPMESGEEGEQSLSPFAKLRLPARVVTISTPLVVLACNLHNHRTAPKKDERHAGAGRAEGSGEPGEASCRPGARRTLRVARPSLDRAARARTSCSRNAMICLSTCHGTLQTCVRRARRRRQSESMVGQAERARAHGRGSAARLHRLPRGGGLGE